MTNLHGNNQEKFIQHRMKENEKINIWTSYHIKEIPKEYNIKENDNIKLFYTNDLKLKKDNIN